MAAWSTPPRRRNARTSSARPTAARSGSSREVQIAVLGLQREADGAERVADLMDLRREDDRTARTVARQRRGGATVAEDRRADRLCPWVIAAGGHEDAAHAVGGHHEGLLARLLQQRLRGQTHERNGAGAADADEVVAVGRRWHLVMLDEALCQRGVAERVQARAHHSADPCRIEAELVNRGDPVGEQLVLDLGAAPLQGATEEVLAQVQVAPAHPAAGEDALGELVTLEPEVRQHVLLGDRWPEVGDRQPRDAGLRRYAPRLGGRIRPDRAGAHLACAGGAQLWQPPGSRGWGVGGLRTGRGPVRPVG